ncbi:MAG TPA: sigma-54 dependent transcriptional regulator [Bryobacteraceae bacterium]|nr:sigma-54 dependent transcriptional regulator [Bryobacteraceae bacterium]
MKHSASILIAEDEPAAREALRELLEEEGYRVFTAARGDEALEFLMEMRVEAAVLDVKMPGCDGLSILRELQRHDSAPAVLVMTAYGTSSIAIEAMTLGAFDYLTKPIDFAELLILLRRAIESRRRNQDLETWRTVDAEASEGQMIGSSPPMQAMYKLIGQVAPTDCTVLIRGESGTGKELVARAIHQHSPRKHRPLVKVNCAAIPDTVLEAELFGHEKGAFTGAVARRLGKFEYANGGTIFLDEISELSVGTQAKLLRVMQEHTIERLGGNATIALDIRVLAATNRDLEAAVKSGVFREDLFFRLKVVEVVAPALRDRRTDIPELAQRLSQRSAKKLRLPVPSVSEEALEWLQRQEWPGNVRELEHALERALVLSRNGVIGPEHFTLQPATGGADMFDNVPLEWGLHEAVSRLERRLLKRALEASAGNRSRAADLLKINRRLLYERLREFGID